MTGQTAATARALELAYRYVSRRERTVHEVRQHLRARELDEAAVSAAVTELTDAGYLDDARFARLFVEDKRALEQWGSARIRRGLLARGIDSEVADTALEDERSPAADPSDPSMAGLAGQTSGAGARPDAPTGDFDRALALLRRRFPEPPRDRREHRRALGVLLRRGYEPELALDALGAHSRARD